MHKAQRRLHNWEFSVDITWSSVFRRPLKQFNRKSIALLVVFWIVVLLSFGGCSPAPAYLATAYVAVTVCVVLWANHLAMAPVNRTKDAFILLAIALYDLFSIFALVILAFIPFSLLQHECYTSRAKVSELILATANYRNQISERFESLKTLSNIGTGLQVELSKRVRSGIVTPDGTIVLASEDPPAVVVVALHIEAGKLTWKCSGVPRSVMPKLCAEQPSQ
jgi:hypothetical protein